MGKQADEANASGLKHEQFLSFQKNELALTTVTAQNDDVARTFWQSEQLELLADETIQPPG